MPAQEPETITEEERETTVIAPVNNNNEDDEHRPRLCHIRKWHDFQGYGFNLHAEKNKPGQYIGKVDDDSPAESAGLKENDRIIEVNGDNVEQEQHQNVIGKIKSGGEETKLLVVDPKTDAILPSEPAPVHVSDETDGRPAGMSAKEYLESLKKKKRADPRNQRMDFKQKHDLFQKM
ncbi:hypothetical protein LOTGIDRAFT_223723 [Lottia gigantea]|uniref:PDZ domain-containing protein n=1 Tax=Lottia gigantea TaxID=225164 RepID=V4CQF1_LOTGI|nr:hypothetical protein LOTGIDRAFT_223723 [Lottia gigantea]ESP04690.1 hypothetical protein LOTGIDRAFT_223723 [Lottia gigantea]